MAQSNANKHTNIIFIRIYATNKTALKYKKKNLCYNSQAIGMPFFLDIYIFFIFSPIIDEQKHGAEHRIVIAKNSNTRNKWSFFCHWNMIGLLFYRLFYFLLLFFCQLEEKLNWENISDQTYSYPKGWRVSGHHGGKLPEPLGPYSGVYRLSDNRCEFFQPRFI